MSVPFPLLIPAALLLGASLPRARDEQVEPIPYCPEIVTVFVHGGTGMDPDFSSPTLATDLLAYIDNPAQPFQTIQAAIDGCYLGVRDRWQTYHGAQGVVYVMPGVYGPTAAQSKVDTLPICMRDRVHVQGQGMRSTTIRGGGADTIEVFWPNAETCGTRTDVEVLVDFSTEWAGLPGYAPPWDDNSEEMIDRIGFQGGDVQVFSGGEGMGLGRISNCLFDMRHDENEGGLAGPYVGLLMTHRWFGVTFQTPTGYWDRPLKVFNNTFILGEISAAEEHQARPEAVAIIDVVEPLCPLAPSQRDPDPMLRGVGSPSIQNNLIRTLFTQSTQWAMLGIDSTDTGVATGTSTGPSNAFRVSKVGGANGTFTLYSKIPAGGSPPVPKVNVGNKVRDPKDPCFVGELLSTCASCGVPAEYRDWRLMFGSPLAGKGSSPDAGGQLAALNGTTYYEPGCFELSSFRWDGEGYGNPRVIEGIEIGCDELHLMIMAGNWANDSVSHNLIPVPNPLDPNIASVGAPTRLIYYPDWAAGDVTVNGRSLAHATTTPIPAWSAPPGTVTPKIDPSFPAFYQKRYIPFTNPSPSPTAPSGWGGPGAITSSSLYNPISTATLPVGLFSQFDDESVSPGVSGPARYFSTQSVVTASGALYRSNLQSEYR